MSAFLALGVCLLVFHAERVEGCFRAFGAIVEYSEKSLPHPRSFPSRYYTGITPEHTRRKIFYPTPHPHFSKGGIPRKIYHTHGGLTNG